MQQEQALKNEHFKKIWEKVNWQSRNPQAASLEEALKFEKRHFDCVFIYNNIYGCCGENCIDLREQINNYNALANEHGESLNFFEKQKFMKTIDSNAKILGRPITLFDILNLLQKNTKNGEFALMTNCIVLCNIDATRNTSNDIFPYFVKKICDINNESILLEEQSPETWEEISKLINK